METCNPKTQESAHDSFSSSFADCNGVFEPRLSYKSQHLLKCDCLFPIVADECVRHISVQFSSNPTRRVNMKCVVKSRDLALKVIYRCQCLPKSRIGTCYQPMKLHIGGGLMDTSGSWGWALSRDPGSDGTLGFPGVPTGFPNLPWDPTVSMDPQGAQKRTQHNICHKSVHGHRHLRYRPI